jgi:hypothetical protein
MEIPHIMNESQIIAQGFCQLRQFFCDVALLLRTADESFAQKGWNPSPTSNACALGGTFSLTNPKAWLPELFFRTYHSPKRRTMHCYVAVYFDIPIGQEGESQVYLTAGGLFFDHKLPLEKAGSTEMAERLMCHFWREDRDDSGRFMPQERPFHWTHGSVPNAVRDMDTLVHDMVTCALPLHEIGSSQMLDSRVVDPLVREIEETGLKYSPLRHVM